MTAPADATEGSPVTIRPERPGDEAAIAEVLRRAFGREDEATLVYRLRADGETTVTFIATDVGRIVGHVLFCPISIVGPDEPVPALALAPLAVLPSHQRRGIGARLVRAGLAAAEGARHRIVTVLGHAEYYTRFGFTTEAAERLDVPFPRSAWMALELAPGALAGVSGRVVYPRAFGISVDEA